MTRDRMIELLNLVNDFNDLRRHIDVDFHASFKVNMYSVDVDVFHYGKVEDGIKAHCYSTHINDCVWHGIKYISDPELKQAEAHLRRLIYELSRVDG